MSELLALEIDLTMASPEDVQPTATSTNTVVVSGNQSLQESGSRMLPLFLIQGTPSPMKMTTHVSSSSVRPQNVPYTLRPTFIRAPNSGKQQHFVIQTTQPSGMSTTSSVKNRVFLTPVIRPSTVKSGENSQKLVFANRPLSTTNSQTKMTSLLVPVSVNSSNSNIMKITSRNMYSDKKGVMLQSGIHNIGHPVSGQLIHNTVNVGSIGTIGSASTTVTEQCPVPVVEMEISDEECVSDSGKAQNQDLNRCYQEAVEAIFAPSVSPRVSEGSRDNCDLDDNVTVIRVTSEHEEPKKELPEDDVKIELVQPDNTWDSSTIQQEIETEQSEVEAEVEIIQTEVGAQQDANNEKPDTKLGDAEKIEIEHDIEILETEMTSEVEIIQSEVKTTTETESASILKSDPVVKDSTSECKTQVEPTEVKEFDPMEVLDWKDGIGSLPGSDLKFCMNEFGMMEMVEHSNDSKHTSENTEKVKEIEDMRIQRSAENNVSEIRETVIQSAVEEGERVDISDQIFRCESCGVYGTGSEFIKTRFCSHMCEKVGMKKKAQEMKKQRDLLRLKQVRKMKRARQLELQQKVHEESQQSPVVPAPTSSFSEEDENGQDASKTKVPAWQMGKKGFSWTKYLEHCKAKGAPVKLFKDPFPYSKNGFKIGMKLEGIDPQHPAYYCVLTVSDVLGYRIRLHFDGYSEMHDFWVNADSLNIFPVGWCEKTGRQLHLPPGYSLPYFSWSVYLKESQAQAAPRHLFANRTGSSVCPSVFRVGMKLEAVDRWNSFLVCVATVADVIDSRILVHLDGRDNAYDFWADATSPYIHPVGWCKKNGQFLTPPLHWKPPQSFSWDQYLKETKSQAVPARAFKQRPPCGFRAGMKLECVDKRVPLLIRVATVGEVYEHRIKIQFDGWPEEFSYWLDDDSPDIHPPGWCQKTGHPLETPLMPEDLGEPVSDCPTSGCHGKGNINGSSNHNLLAECPYAPENYNKDGPIQDRLLEDKVRSPENNMKRSVKSEKRNPIGRPPKYRYIQKDETYEEGNDLKRQNDKPDVTPRPVGRPPKHRRIEVKEDQAEDMKKKSRVCCDKQEQCNCNETPQEKQWGVNIEQLRQELHESIMRPGPLFLSEKKTSLMWSKHSNNLYKYIDDMKIDVNQWTPKDVCKFVKSIPGCDDKAAIFVKEKIDGEGLLLMSQQDLIQLGLKLGPALKLYNSIVLLRFKKGNV
ncbi:lethal(3)malignant brain tumor-like protein 3 [Anabrus simplex]|uniref:lethal(3)malignant brain tumor-like protein 3 n=1 Tax=Anabrus simplex TaxID=316456 RepID=UPI0035A2835F